MMDLNEYIEAKRVVDAGQSTFLLECVDGFCISAWAGEYYGVVPQGFTLPYFAVACYSASSPPDALESYWAGLYYTEVPVAVLEKLIDSHGGLVSELGKTSSIVRPELMRKRVSQW